MTWQIVYWLISLRLNFYLFFSSFLFFNNHVLINLIIKIINYICLRAKNMEDFRSLNFLRILTCAYVCVCVCMHYARGHREKICRSMSERAVEFTRVFTWFVMVLNRLSLISVARANTGALKRPYVVPAVDFIHCTNILRIRDSNRGWERAKRTTE